MNWNKELSLRAACEDCGDADLSYSWDLFLVNATERDREEGTDHIASFPFYFFRERVEGEGETHGCERDTSPGCLLHTPDLGWGLSLQPRYVPLT